MNCGCRAKYSIDYCPLHGAAEKLLESAQAVLATIEPAVNAGFRLPGPLLDALDGMRAIVKGVTE